MGENGRENEKDSGRGKVSVCVNLRYKKTVHLCDYVSECVSPKVCDFLNLSVCAHVHGIRVCVILSAPLVALRPKYFPLITYKRFREGS